MSTPRLVSVLSLALLLACDSRVRGVSGLGGSDSPASERGPRAADPAPLPTAPAPEPRPTPLPPEVPEAQRPFVLPPVQREVQEYELELPPGLRERFLADKDTPEHAAVFRCAGVSYPVRVRLRGASARDFPKKSWNVSFEHGVRFEGRTSLNLVAEYSDATLLAEKLSFDLLEALRVPAPHAKYVRLRLDGQDEGVFLDIEQVDKSFLRAHAFADEDATLYRAGWKDTELKLRDWKVGYQGDWQRKTNRAGADEALDAVLYVLNRTPEPALPEALERHLELEGYLRSMVMDALMANNYVEDSESYLIHDRVRDRWVYVPWDLNNVDARWWYPIPLDEDLRPIYRQPLFTFTLTNAEVARRYEERKDIHPGYLPVFSNPATRVVLNPVLRARLLARLDKALAELFTLEVMGPYIDALHTLIAPGMSHDPYMDLAKFQAGRGFMRDFVRLRRQFLREELERQRERAPGLVLEALDAREGWVELSNRGTTPLELGGRVLTTNLRRSLPSLLEPETPGGARMGVQLAEQTLAPGEHVRFTASDLGLPLTLDGEVGVFDGSSVVGMADALFYGRLPEGEHYARDAEGVWRVR